MSPKKDLRWFKDAKFGMFIHWGLYSLPGGIWKGKGMDYIGEWLQSKFRIPNDEYARLAAEFNPVGFDADEWVLAAKNAGMRYMVFTAKHHDGFAMYHSRCDQFNIVDSTPFGRDPLAELAASCRKHGLKLGIYYSQDLDWHDPDGGDPGPESLRNFDMSWGNDWDFPDYATKNYHRYFERKVIPQLTELLTNYGSIDIVWFDCPDSISREESECLLELVKELQPECLVNSRIGNGLGDYEALGDNRCPSARRDGAWETPGTMNDTWGFKYNDSNWKSPFEIVQLLTNLADKDANYLLNVGPRGDGRFPDAALRTLKGVGAWMKTYGDCIHGSRGNPFPYDFAWGQMTVSCGKAGHCTRLNLISGGHAFGTVVILGLRERVIRCYDAARPGDDLPFTVSEICGVKMLRIEADGVCGDLPPVLIVELDTEQYPCVEGRLIPQDGRLCLKPIQGRLIHGDTDLPATEQGFRTDCGLLKVGVHSFVDNAGHLIEWHNPKDCIEWDVVFFEPDDYMVELVTTSRDHSAPWTGGQMVRISYESGDDRIVWEVELTGSPLGTTVSRCYAEGVSSAGMLAVRRSGTGKLSLTMLDLGSHAAVGMGLTEVRLTILSNP